jgi:2'-5' RNA ligase
MHRLFAALRPSSTMRRQLAATMAGVAGARWQSDAQLHLTLRFIGEVDRPQAEDIAAVLGVVRADKISIGVDGVGCFGPDRHPHSLWAGVRPDEALTRLQRGIDRALVRAGIAPETRAFHPHITVARLARSAGSVDRWLADHAAFRIAAESASDFALYESHLGSGEAHYEEIVRYPLR